MAKKLPRGLQEFEGSLHDLEYAPRLLPRLLDLPENGLANMLKEFEGKLAVAEEAEKKAVAARNEARKVAEKMWQAAVTNWSIKELQEATGYDDE